MRSYTTEQYRKCFAALPKEIKRAARIAFRRWQANPSHPSLRFKLVSRKQSIYSVRVARGWRALGVRDDDRIVWFWIGSHADYDWLLSRR